MDPCTLVSIVTNLSRSFSDSLSKRFRLAGDIFCLVCFWSTVRSLGTQRAVLPYELFPEKSQQHYVSLCNLSVTYNHTMDLSDYFGSYHNDRPSQSGSSSRLSLPCLNSATHLFTIAYERVSFQISMKTLFMQILNHRTFSNFVHFAIATPPFFFLLTCYHFYIN